MDPQAELLLRKADEDRHALDFDLPHPIFGFHAQQACEKLLKALIASRNVKFERTHDLQRLLDHAAELGLGPLAVPPSFQALQAYAVEFRYDEPLPQASLDFPALRAELEHSEPLLF